MSKRPGRGVRCRGTCKDGHTTEVTSEPGRVSWHGPCPHDGCRLKVYARRVPDSTPPPPDTKTTDTHAGEDPHRVLEVSAYRDEPQPQPERPDEPERPGDGAGGAGGDDQPAAPPRPAHQRGRRAAAPAPPVHPEPGPPARPRGVLGRLRHRLNAGAEHDDDGELFGVF